MIKGIIYYTDLKVREPIFSTVQKYLLQANLPITSVSLAPINFGNNFVFNGKRSYPTYIRQITMALENAKEDYVFFCEHDVLYHKTHFDFNPPKDDIFYYNNNIWRWKLWNFKLITYDKMRSLSCLCVNRKFALEHYKRRVKAMEEQGLDEFRSREPRMGRVWGYEPGTKPKRRGGFSDDVCGDCFSEFPNIDIRHSKTFTSIKCDLKDFKHPPENWREIRYDQVPGWDLKAIFPEGMKNHTSNTLDFDNWENYQN
jgi:hypothetical protein